TLNQNILTCRHSRPVMTCSGRILCDALAQRRSLYVPYRSKYMSLFCVGTEVIQVGDGSTVCSWLLAPGHKARAIVTVCCVLVFNKKPSQIYHASVICYNILVLLLSCIHTQVTGWVWQRERGRAMMHTDISDLATGAKLCCCN